MSFLRGVTALRCLAQARALHTHVPARATIPIPLPALSPTMTEGTIVAWHKKIGDKVTVGDVLFDIETDKATMAVESTEDGYLAQILLGDQSSGIPLNTVVAYMVEEQGEAVKIPEKKAPAPKAAAPAAPAPPAPATQTPTPAPAAAAASAGPIAGSTKKPLSPAVRALVSSLHVDPQTIPATGPKGHLLKGDVLAFVKGEVPKASAAPSAAAAAPTPSIAPSAAAAGTTSRRIVRGRGMTGGAAAATYTDIPASNVRKVIASRLTESKTTIPHAYTTETADIGPLSTLRKKIIADGSAKFSINDVLVKAAALALRTVPAVNKAWKAGELLSPATVDISVAVATPNGLITPIVFNADQRDVFQISSTVGELAARAKENKLKPEEFQGGSFTISNLGMFGIESFSAVINPPQTCILAVGTSKPAVNGNNEVYTQMSFTLSYDARAVDATDAAQWLAAFKTFLENPAVLVRAPPAADF